MKKTNKKETKKEIKDDNLKNQSNLLLTVIGCMAVLIVAVITTVSLNMRGTYSANNLMDAYCAMYPNTEACGGSDPNVSQEEHNNNNSGNTTPTAPTCGANAYFTGTVCRCSSGYTGDGYTCTKESTTPTTPTAPTCGANAYFTGTVCRCSSGYTGDGYTCTKVSTTPTCGEHAHVNVSGTTCVCDSGYTGDGQTCTKVATTSTCATNGGPTKSGCTSAATAACPNGYTGCNGGDENGCYTYTCTSGSTTPTTPTKCGAGQGADSSASSGCSNCAAGTYSPANDNTCYPCPSGTSSSAGASQCTSSTPDCKNLAGGSCMINGQSGIIQDDCTCKVSGSGVEGACNDKAGKVCYENGQAGVYLNNCTCYVSSAMQTCLDAGKSWEFGRCWDDDSVSCEKLNYGCTVKAGATCTYGYTGCNTCNGAGFICKNEDGSKMDATETNNAICRDNANIYCGVGNWSGCTSGSTIGYTCNTTVGCTYGPSVTQFNSSSNTCGVTFSVTAANGADAAYCCTRAGARLSGSNCYKECSCGEKMCVYGNKKSNCTTYAVEQCGVGNYTGCDTPDSDGCYSYTCKSGSGETNKCYKCSTSSGDKYVTTVSAANAAVVTGGSNCTTVSDSYCANPPGEDPPTGGGSDPETDKCYYCKITDTTGIYVVSTSSSKALTAAKAINSDVTSCQVDSTQSMQKCDGGTPVEPEPTTPTTNCYRCKLSSNSYMYTKAKSASEAATITKGTECGIVDSSMCSIPSTSTSTSTPVVNPPTGGTAIIIAWIIGIFAIVYSVWYFSKNSELEKK